MEAQDMQILALGRRQPESAMAPEEAQQHLLAEIHGVWELYAQGICRELYSRAGIPGSAVLLLECESAEAAQAALATLPLVRLGVIGFDLIPLAPFTNLSRLFGAAS
jgi:hypothetical protein